MKNNIKDMLKGMETQRGLTQKISIGGSMLEFSDNKKVFYVDDNENMNSIRKYISNMEDIKNLCYSDDLRTDVYFKNGIKALVIKNIKLKNMY
ncbi:hypothetical protein LZ906_017420 (plasmid) [Paraclostridium ghonii]|uniref:hypothetical protein n=1 Tax=Paraclostridium ghonii TaxID=29358 RepID=UPI00202CBC2E|nr:hypothetical protein [Paeniclostridium ghonii]MCM0167610.1 hypothetical protein [Paeniclostridium ghonii]